MVILTRWGPTSRQDHHLAPVAMLRPTIAEQPITHRSSLAHRHWHTIVATWLVRSRWPSLLRSTVFDDEPIPPDLLDKYLKMYFLPGSSRSISRQEIPTCHALYACATRRFVIRINARLRMYFDFVLLFHSRPTSADPILPTIILKSENLPLSNRPTTVAVTARGH